MERFALTLFTEQDPRIFVIDVQSGVDVLHAKYPQYSESLSMLMDYQKRFLSILAVFRSAHFVGRIGPLMQTYEAMEEAWFDVYRRVKGCPVVKRFFADDYNLTFLQKAVDRTTQLHKDLDGFVQRQEQIFPRFRSCGHV